MESTTTVVRVKGTTFSFSTNVPTERREKILAKAQKSVGRVRLGTKYGLTIGPVPASARNVLGNHASLATAIMPVPCGATLQWRDGRTVRQAEVWSPGPRPGTVWAISDGDYVCLQKYHDGTYGLS